MWWHSFCVLSLVIQSVFFQGLQGVILDLCSPHTMERFNSLCWTDRVSVCVCVCLCVLTLFLYLRDCLKELSQAVAMLALVHLQVKDAQETLPALEPQQDTVRIRMRNAEQWGPFQLIRKSQGYQATCPFHRGTDTAPRCRHFVSMRSEAAEDEEMCLRILQDWCLAYSHYDRKRTHLRHPAPAEIPSLSQLDHMCCVWLS